MSKLYPYIRFNDEKCREAMAFYKAALGGEVEIMTLGETPMAKDMPQAKDRVMHATLKRGSDLLLIGADMMRDKATIGDNVTIMMDCDSEQQLNDVFNKLSAGGEVFMKPEETFWGAIFGMLTDKYGVEWSLNFQKKQMK